MLFISISSAALPLFISNFVTIVLIVFFGRDRLRQQEAYKAQVIRLEAKALKAQMNPHFIFNTLNSIQSILFLEGQEKANYYMGVFSGLLRKTLDMSVSQDYELSLQDELDYIEEYLQLQNLRMNKPIELKITIDPTLNVDRCKIAPMLLQPLVENAILHGISPLKKAGKITIDIRKQGKILTIFVEDNGVGRKESSVQKKALGQKISKRKSHATNILSERIDGFNYLHKVTCEFFLEDIIKEKQIKGTRAVLKLPLITK